MKYDSINLCNLLLSLSDALDLAHPEITFHQQRTAYIALMICKNINFPEESIKNIFIAALLHDIGAVSIEEKVKLHSFEEVNVNLHCNKGELLLKRYKPFENAAKIVKYHHKKWFEYTKDKNDPASLSSQILCLSDYSERLINKNINILNQKKIIIDKINLLSGTDFNPELVKILNEISKKESFWLDIASPKLYSRLLYSSPIKDVIINTDDFESITKLFRDIIDFKSSFTAAHSTGVSACAEMIGKIIGMNDESLFEIKIAGNLHDLGKLMVPNIILEKKSKLTNNEMNIMKCHPYYSFHIINSVMGLKAIAEMAGYHHEKLDGSGYPFHITADDISISSRIIAVSDIFTAIIEDRPYRSGMKKQDVISILNNLSKNKELDNKITEIITGNFDKIYEHILNIESLIKEFYNTRIENLN